MRTRDLLTCSGIVAALSFASDATRAQEGSWTATSLVAAPSARYQHTAVWTGSRMIVWGGEDGSVALKTGAAHEPTTDTWTPTSAPNAPTARHSHSAVWTGSRMIVWGGYDGAGANVGDYLATGAAYDPTTDSWTPTSTVSSPSERSGHTAVWTGSRMIVWGGYGDGGPVNTGAAYDPTTDTWTPTSTLNAASARNSHTAVWTGSRMIVWGGGLLNTGSVYDPATDTWTPTTTVDAPTARIGHTVVWTRSRMIVWGGYGSGDLSSGAAYDPTTDAWTPTTTVDAPTARFGHTAVWTGSRMLVWGGGDEIDNRNTGAAYDPTTDTWTATTTASAPSPRGGHRAVWTGSRMIISGGYGGTPLDTGGIYDPMLGQSFHTVTPCRLIDTRDAHGPLGGPAMAANTNRSFVAVGHCEIPLTAQALSVNLTATAQTAQGHLRLYAGGTTPPNTSSLNYAAGQTRASNATVMLGTLGDVGVRCVQGSGTAHVVIDVSGYFE